MTDTQFDSISDLIMTIKASQKRLQLTNRAILSIVNLQSEKETDFFSGQVSRGNYEQTLTALQTIERLLNQQNVPLTAYLQQLRALPLRNIFLRNRYAFWFANFIEAGGSASILIRDAKENGFEIINQIVWSSNLLTSTSGVAHIQTHQKQLVRLSEKEFQTIESVVQRFSTASPLFFHNLTQLFNDGLITKLPELKQYWDQETRLIRIE